MTTITATTYFAEVNTMAKSIFGEVMQDNDSDFGTCQDDGLFYDRLHETIDGHEWVIYCHYNLQVLQHATNPEAMIDDMGAEAAGHSLSEGGLSGLHTALAFWALYNDVSEALSEIVDDYEPEEEQDDK